MDAVTESLGAHERRIDRDTDESTALENTAWRIARNEAELREVIEGWLMETDVDTVGLMARLFASRLPKPPEFAGELEKCIADLCAGITEAVDKQARYELDNLGDLE